MSFQGDVGGIGLADLLQSLARGREGVLSLLGKGGLKATVGIQDSLVHLLPDPDEDPEIWRHRARQAWVKGPDNRIDSLRMVEIARAARVENIFRLLDSDGVHFRFAPGPLPERPHETPELSAGETGEERKGQRRDAVFISGMSVEGLLLEYARLKDEAQSKNLEWPGFEDAVLIVLENGDPPKDVARFHAECDGESTLSEMADRLGWPLRQIELAAVGELSRGALRLSTPSELIALCQHEVGAGYADRGAARLRSWAACAPIGRLPSLEAQIFQTEWEAGRLQPVLRSLPVSVARTFLRRLDSGLGSPLLALDHWGELTRVKREDRIAHVRLVHLQTIASGDPSVPAVRDLLAMSRAFLESERHFAAGAVLRIAAAKAPEGTNVRLEIGMGLLSAGLGSEAVPWILDAATALFEIGDVEKALPPLRALVEVEPTNREARRLLARGRAQVVQRTLVKKNSLVTIAVVLALSVSAFVQFRSHQTFSGKVEEVKSHSANPHEALKVLDQLLGYDDSSSVRELRNSLLEKAKLADAAARTAWVDRYREAQNECMLGDPVLGLKRVTQLPVAPPLVDSDNPLPLESDLYNGMGGRIDGQIKSLGTSIEDTPAQVKAEAKISRLITELQGVLGPTPKKQAALDFADLLAGFAKNLQARGDKRALDRAERDKSANLADQDRLLGAARAHDKAGDYQHSIELYKLLIKSDKDGKITPLVAPEMQRVQAKVDSVANATKLAEQGQHKEAHALLAKALGEDAANEVVLPWKVVTFPAGARAKFEDKNENDKTAPFVLETTWLERTHFTLSMEGYESRDLVAEHPGDQSVWLSRLPERAWNRGGRIESIPVRVGEDQVVCDRNGHIARLTKSSQLIWSHDLKSLGGIGRSPVFLPKSQGHLLCVTEDGEAWVIDANDGTIEGPWSNGSPPVLGPTPIDGGARVRFRDGTAFDWTSRLKPEPAPATAVEPPPNDREDEFGGSNAGLAVLRRRSSSATHLDSPWSDLTVEITSGFFVVRQKNAKDPLFAAARGGDWVYIAWEAPMAMIPRGRLWISDGKGLRAIVPAPPPPPEPPRSK